MTREQLETYLHSQGWTRDRFGHYHRQGYRFKLQARSCRLESKTSSGEWVRLRSGYYSALTVNSGKLSGLTY